VCSSDLKKMLSSLWKLEWTKKKYRNSDNICFMLTNYSTLLYDLDF